MRKSWILVAAVAVGSLAVSLVACYNPNPENGAFQCTADNGYLCPEGLTCDRLGGLCVKQVPPDLGGGDRLPNFDGSPISTPRSCEQRVQQGAFSGLANLGAINTAGDQGEITINGSQLVYLDGTAVMTAALTGKKSAGSGSAVTITGAPAVVYGGSFAKDGSYWFSGGNGTASNLFKATGTLPSLTATLQPQPNTTDCPFFDPIFTEGDPTNELYVAYPLAGCSMPQGRGVTVAQGSLGKNIGTFYVAFPGYNFRAPFVLPGGTTMLVASVGASPRLFYSTRAQANIDAGWSQPQPLPMGTIGTGNRDVQAVVSADCSTIYIVSDRAGGAGGLDVWAADIAAQ